MTVLPVRSMRAALAGAVISHLRPTLVMRLFSTRNAEFSMGAPQSPVISRAPSNNIADGGVAGEQAIKVKHRQPSKVRIDVK